jgi:hypothetical protein
MSSPAMQLPGEAPVLTVVPDAPAEEKAWNFGDVPVQGELFPANYDAA